MALTVSQVARLAKISIRALHHYDELGLLCPSDRSEAGYRLYSQADLQKLQQVLFFKELGFPLEEIRRIVGDPTFDLRAALRMQRQLLTEQSARLDALVHAVDAALDALEKGTHVDKEDMFEAFGDFDPAKYEEEAKQRWGNTEAYKESSRKAARYKKEDWTRIKAEGDALFQSMADLLAAGTSAASDAAMDLAEAHRQYLGRWFYMCPPAMHRGLGELYVADTRFTENIDKVRPGLSLFLRDAFAANAERQGAGDACC